MPIGLMFWILMLVWAVFYLLGNFGVIGGPYWTGGNTLLIFVLFLLLGWGQFGSPIQR